jgi:hypothetical protein
VKVRPGQRREQRIEAHSPTAIAEVSEGRENQEPTTWRLEALLEAYGYDEVTAKAREAVEERLHQEGLGVDPPLGRAWPRTDVWVYLLSPEETETWAQREQTTARATSSPARQGLSGREKAAILTVCGVLVIAGALLVLDSTGVFSALLAKDPAGSGHGIGQLSRLEASFRGEYEAALRSQPESMQAKKVRCLRTGKEAYRCIAYTEAMGSTKYPDDFELARDVRGCWQARPISPNLIDATIAGCS